MSLVLENTRFKQNTFLRIYFYTSAVLLFGIWNTNIGAA